MSTILNIEAGYGFSPSSLFFSILFLTLVIAAPEIILTSFYYWGLNSSLRVLFLGSSGNTIVYELCI